MRPFAEEEEQWSGRLIFKNENRNEHNSFRRGRDDRIRTCGPLVPNQMRYQTALHPDSIRTATTLIMILYFVVNVNYIF